MSSESLTLVQKRLQLWRSTHSQLEHGKGGGKTRCCLGAGALGIGQNFSYLETDEGSCSGDRARQAWRLGS
jgi:hypothetical protein